MLETYITHIKIMEYSSHPSTPPPPEAINNQTEKPRVIIVAVRKSGRVRMHKSKENANGTFSIGKTWDLNDLSTLESFTSTSVEPRKRQWAGDTGFVVNIGKPYFWQCQADKEKKFFIASLIKIYSKYTGGKLPELVGFDPRELDQVLGSRRLPAQGRPGAGEAPPPPRPEVTNKLPLPTNTSPGIQAYQPPPRPPPSPGRNFPPQNGKPASPASSFDSGRAPGQPPTLRRLAGNNASQETISTGRSDDANSLPPRSRNGPNGPSAFGRFADREPAKTPPPQPQAQVPPPPSAPVDLPDRRRPPMDPSRPQGATPMDNDLVPAPLMSPGRKDPQPPPRNVERMSPRKVSGPPHFAPPSAPKEEQEEKPPVVPEPEVPTPPLTTSTLASVQSPTTSETPISEAPRGSQDESRPGLGPMIKSKKSKGDIAGSFWKAASAASVFKPRPGGAAERLRELKRANSGGEGPDGITQVVPAPPRAKPEPEPLKIEEVPTPPEPPKSPAVPEVKITVPNSSRPTSTQSLPKVEKKSVEVVKKPSEERPAVMMGNDAKYLSTLGIDTSILAGQTAEFSKLLDHFGWIPGEKMRNRNFEEMKMDVDRQLNKAQAGDWVVRFEEEDSRIDAIKRGLDLAIVECDELENLLTLYSVELSVSPPRSSSYVVLTPSRLCPRISRISRRKDKVYRFKPPTRNC